MFVKRLKETINPMNVLTSDTATSSGSKPSTHSSSLEDSHVNSSSNDHTEHAYEVIAF